MFTFLIETLGQDGTRSRSEETELRAGDEVLWHAGQVQFFRKLRPDELPRYRRVRRTEMALLRLRTETGTQDALALPIRREIDACAALITRYGEQLPCLRAWDWATLGLFERLPGRQRFRACSRPV